MKRILTAVLLSACATMALADGPKTVQIGKVESVTIDKPVLKVGEKYTLTVSGLQPLGAPCNMAVSIDGGVMWSPLGDATVFPFYGAPGGVYATFKNPGNYTIKVQGTQKPGAVCDGSASVNVKVEPALTVNPAAVAVALSPCPAGWHGSAQPSGAFTCKPNKPATKIQCPPKTQYFETDCEIGCQQVIY